MNKFLSLFLFLFLSISSMEAQTMYSKLAYQYAKQGDFEKAIELENEGLKILESIHGKENEEYANTLNQIARFYSEVYLYEEACEKENQALKIISNIYGQKNELYATFLGNLSQYLYFLGDFNTAINYQLSAIEILSDLFGNSSIELESSLNNLTIYYLDSGDLNKSLDVALRCLNIQKANLSSQNEMSTTLSNLSVIYGELGDIRDAIFYIKEALAIDSLESKIYTDDYITTLSNLATYHADIGEVDEAIELGRKIVELDSLYNGINSINYIESLNNLASFLSLAKNNKEAIELTQKALGLEYNILGYNHPLYSIILNNLAFCYMDDNGLEQASMLIDEVVKNRESFYGIQHTKYLDALSNQTIISFKLKEYSNVNKLINFINPERRIKILKDLLFLPLNTRKSYLNKYFNWFNRNIPFFVYSFPSHPPLHEAFNTILFTKGILLNSEIEFDKFLLETGDEALLEKYNEIRELRLQLNKLYEKPVAERWCDIDSLERVANNLERELMYESKEFGDYTRNLSITWQDVQKGLKQKDVAVEFVSFPLNQDSTMYMAYVLKPEMDSPQMVKLFEEKDLAYLSSSENPAEIYNKVEASNLIWLKLEPYLEGCENVYFAPDGILHQTAIEYLPDFNGEGMIADRYNLHRLSSTRQLAVSHDNNPSRSGAVFGGIEYSNDVKSMEQESGKYRDFNPLAYVAPRSGELGLRASAGYLEGTKEEAEQVERTLKGNSYATKLLTGQEANEEAFKDLSGRNNGIIHIATHGFYWKQEEADSLARANERLMFMTGLDDRGSRHVEDMALTRSGLLMAGANNTLDKTREDEVPEGVDDGILTAQEIAQMNLRGTDLVVLSACQTGLGEISGDGVFGLQRGFKKAGANSLLMSLWKVDDDATQILMEAFYRNLMAGHSKQQALRNAQKSVRDEGFLDPKFWAAFILLDGLN